VPVAVTLLSRLLGLALLSPGRAGAGLLIPRCRSVHTFGMRFEIDVLFLDEARRPIAVARGVRANRVVGRRDAASVLEVPARAGAG
jgi:hypothetical protein